MISSLIMNAFRSGYALAHNDQLLSTTKSSIREVAKKGFEGRPTAMSMEMRVFFAGPMPTPVAVIQSMQRLGLNFAITDHRCEFEAASGFMPMSYGKGADALETGVEVYVGSARETVDELGIEGIDPSLNNEISFRWGSNAMEGACAEALAAAIATLTGGVIWDDSEGVIISVETAVKYCHELSTAE